MKKDKRERVVDNAYKMNQDKILSEIKQAESDALLAVSLALKAKSFKPAPAEPPKPVTLSFQTMTNRKFTVDTTTAETIRELK